MLFRRPTVAVFLCLVAVSLVSRQANADLVLMLTPSSATNLFVGDTVDVQVFLKDSAQSGSALDPNAGNSGGGLTRFEFQGTFNSPAFILNPSAPGNFTPDAGFNATVTVNNANTFTITGVDATAGLPGVYGSSDPNGGFQLLLGTLHLKANATGTGSTLQITDPSTSVDGFQFGPAGVDTDVFSSAPYTFTANVNAVPEPGSMSLVALAGGGLWLARRRLRRAK